MAMLFDDEMITPSKDKAKNNEWFTPAKYIESARKVMGSIDLDPASCAMANQVVRADRYYTKKENGLSLPWSGNIWLNPPYGRYTGSGRQISWQGAFAKKLTSEWKSGNINQAIILLLGNSCFARYFSDLWEYPLCFFDGSLVFYREDGRREDFGFGSIFVYLGPHEDRFIEIFSQFGHVVKSVSMPRSPAHEQPTLW